MKQECEDEYEEEEVSSSGSETSYSEFSVDRLSVIWEEGSEDLESIGTKESFNLADSELSSPLRRSRSRSMSPGRGRSWTPEEWMASFVRTDSSDSSTQLLLEKAMVGTDSMSSSSVSSSVVDSDNESRGIDFEMSGDLTLDSFLDNGYCWEEDLHKSWTLLSVGTGKEVVVSQSDDEFTFVSCTTGDDTSIMSEGGDSLASSVDEASMAPEDESFVVDTHHNISRQHINYGKSRKSLDKKLNARQLNAFRKLSDPLHRKLAFACSQKLCMMNLKDRKSQRVVANMDPLKRKLSFCLYKKQVQISLLRNKHKLHRPEEIHLMKKSSSERNLGDLLFASKGIKVETNRNSIMKMRLKLELYSGHRRRKNFERSRERLQKNLCKDHGQSLRLKEGKPSKQELDRFGGLQRKESFRKSKQDFEENFKNAEIKQFQSPVRRRQSLPVEKHTPTEKKDFMARMCQSDSNLLWTPDDAKADEAEETVAVARHIIMKRRLNVERYGGVRRRDSFKRSRRMLTKKFDKMKSRLRDVSGGGQLSQEELARFGGLQRENSYKKSRQLFKETFAGADLLNDVTKWSKRLNEGPPPKKRTRRRGRRKNESEIKKKECLDSLDCSATNLEQGLETTPTKKCKDEHWSCNLARKRLKGEMARQKLAQAFDSFQLASPLREERSDTLKKGLAVVESLLKSLELSPKTRRGCKRMENANKRLQDALQGHELLAQRC